LRTHRFPEHRSPAMTSPKHLPADIRNTSRNRGFHW
jgi:hypothetical protein